MSHLFVKKGVITSEVGKTVKVSFSANQVNRLEQEKKAERERAENERASLLAKRIYDFTQQTKNEDELLDEMINSHKKVKTQPQPKHELEQIYEKGFKMLQNLGGFTAGGLGKDNQGRTDIITLQKKTTFTGKAEDNPDYKTNSKKRKLEDQEIETLKAVNRWRKGASSHVDSIRSSEKDDDVNEGTYSAHEVLAKALADPAPIKIIDMRAAELQSKAARQPSAGVILEFLRDKEATQAAEVRTDLLTRKRAEKEMLLAKEELARCEYEVENTEKKQKQLEEFVNGLSSLQSIGPDPERLTGKCKIFVKLFGVSEQLFQQFHLKEYFLKEISQAFTKHFRGEKVFEKWAMDCIFVVVEILRMIHKAPDGLNVGRGEEASEFMADLSPFIKTNVQPALTNYARNIWDHEDPGDLVRLYLEMEKTIPAKVFWECVETSLVKVLCEKVEHWSAEKSQLFPDIWIYPWTPLLSRDPSGISEVLYSKVYRKFRQSLQTWTPKDKFGAKLLLPWKEILPKRVWEDLMFMEVLPKLVSGLEGLGVRPDKLETESLDYLVEWSQCIPEELGREIVDEMVLRKIGEVLEEWADVITPEEKVQWILGWDLFFGEGAEWLQLSIREGLTKLLRGKNEESSLS